MIEEVTALETTTRARAFLVLSALLIAFGALYRYEMIASGIALLVFLAGVRGYLLLAVVALNKCSAYISSTRGVEGEKIYIDVVIKNPTRIPIAFAEVSIRYSSFLKLVEGVRAALILVPPKGYTRIRLGFQARIGTHEIGPIDIVLRDFFAFYRYRGSFSSVGFVKVIPRVSEAEVRRLLVFTRSTGLTRSRRSGFGTEFYSVREYREGDDVRRILWKYFAYKRRFVVKELELETMNRVLFIVDGTNKMVSGPYGYTPFEYSTRIVASIARYLSYRGDYMGLIIAGDSRTYSTTKLERGRKGYREVLETIASYRFEELSISKDDLDSSDRSIMLREALAKALRMLPREKSLVFIFTSYGGENHLNTLSRMVQSLSSLGNEVFIVIPITTTFEIKGLPQWGYAIYRLKVFERTRIELEFVKKLRGRGVKVIATGAEHIPQYIVSMIESVYQYH
ncbi:MAG: DUF58 domain-containing protein [Ignisphaera sp.]